VVEFGQCGGMLILLGVGWECIIAVVLWDAIFFGLLSSIDCDVKTLPHFGAERKNQPNLESSKIPLFAPKRH
jgi:hypothetical protein